MASIISGYNYDIFISYRQKDNRHDGWVTEFVSNLKDELESTFKEEISVYFDINPHDGLLETHDVDESLKEKLKCLIFIPIISRTYCDPKSFAWEHEFKTFVEMASKDQFGLKVKLPNGNVASRVLPVRIHELDHDDITECENVLGGFLRGIEFIYKEAGIDKPLTNDDDERKNLNKTKYRIQVIKVVHAVKELIQGIKNKPTSYKNEKNRFPDSPEMNEITLKEKKQRRYISGSKMFIPVLVLLLLISGGIIAWPKLFNKDALDNLRLADRISVVVLPFQNMSDDPVLNTWQAGIQSELSNKLSNSEELIVRPWETISSILQNYKDAMTASTAYKISSKLNADVFIIGNIKKSGGYSRISAQVFHTKTKNVLKPFSIDDPSGKEGIFHFTDSLSKLINDYLIITVLKRETTPAVHVLGSTKDPEALKNYIDGISSFFKGDWTLAEEFFTNAVVRDTGYSIAKVMLAHASTYDGSYVKAKKLIREVYSERENMSRMDKLFTEWSLALLCGYPEEQVKFIKQLIEANELNAAFHSDLGEIYTDIKEFDKAIPEHEKALALFNKWKSKPMWINCYTSLGKAYHETHQFGKERRIYKKAESDFPDDPALLKRQAILALSTGNSDDADRYISKFCAVCKDQSLPDPEIRSRCASIYAEAGIQNKAEEFYRQALLMDPANPEMMNHLACFLINNDLNFNEGEDLVRKALNMSPENYEYLDTEGLRLFKRHRYEEALKILQKSWDLRMENANYNHEAFLHLEAAKKAVAGGKLSK